MLIGSWNVRTLYRTGSILTLTGWKISWKKTCGKTTTEVGRQRQEGLVAAEHKRMEGMGRGYLEANC
jgi:hypothetical protein